MTDERQWREWAAEFRAGGRPLRAGELARRARRSTVVMAAEAVLTLAACGGVAAVLAIEAWERPHPVILAICAVVAAFLAAAVAVFFRARRDAWRAAVRTPREMAALIRRREEARLREARFSTRAALALGAAVTLWLPWRLWVDLEGYAREPWRAVLGVGGVYLALAAALAGARWWRLRTERALRSAAELERSFDDETGGEA